MGAIGCPENACECDLRHRAWDPNTGRCGACGAKFEDRRAGRLALRAPDRRPSCDIVASYVEQLRCDDAHLALGIGEGVIPLVLADLRDRDAEGRARCGVRLTSGNGRDHLVAAYQQVLDSCVYLVSELDEHGVGLTTHFTEAAFPDKARRWYLHDVQHLCVSQIRAAIHLRAIVEERRRRAAGAVEERSS